MEGIPQHIQRATNYLDGLKEAGKVNDLTTADLKGLGEAAAKHKGFWKVLNTFGIARDHFPNLAVMHLQRYNLSTTFQITPEGAKALVKRGDFEVPADKIVTNADELNLDAAAKKEVNTIRLLESTKNPDHWIQALGEDHIEGLQRLKPETALKDPTKTEAFGEIINNWDALNDMHSQVGHDDFRELWTTACAEGGSRLPDMAKLAELSQIYTRLELPEGVDKLETTRQIYEVTKNAGRQQDYPALGKSNEFREFIIARVTNANGDVAATALASLRVDSSAQEIAHPLAVAFNEAELEKLKGSLGSAFVAVEVALKSGDAAPVESGSRYTDVENHQKHYMSLGSFRGIETPISQITLAEQSFKACGLESRYPAALENAKIGINFSQPPNVSITALGNGLATNQPHLENLLAIKGQFLEAGLGEEAYNQELATNSALPLEALVTEMTQAFNRASLTRFGQELTDNFGAEFAAKAQAALGAEVLSGAKHLKDSGQKATVDQAIATLNRLQASRADDLTTDEFKTALGNFVTNHPEGVVQALATASDETMFQLAKSCNLVSTNRTIGEWTAQNGSKLEPILRELIKTTYPDVDSGAESLRNSGFMQLSREEQMRLIISTIQQRCPLVDSKAIEKIITEESALTMDQRLETIGRMNAWTDKLSKAFPDNPELTKAFVAEMGREYLTMDPVSRVRMGKGPSDFIHGIYKYAEDLSKKQVDGQPIYTPQVIAAAVHSFVKDREAGASSSSSKGPLEKAFDDLPGTFLPFIRDGEKDIFRKCLQEYATTIMQKHYEKLGVPFGDTEQRLARTIASLLNPADHLPTKQFTLESVAMICQAAVDIQKENALDPSIVSEVLRQKFPSQLKTASLSPDHIDANLSKTEATSRQGLIDALEGAKRIANERPTANYGDVIDKTTKNIGGALTSFTRSLVRDLAPATGTAKEKAARLEHLKSLDRHLDELEDAINNTDYRTLEGALAGAGAEDPQGVLNQLKLAKAMIGDKPLNQPPSAQGGLVEIIDLTFEEGVEEVQKLRSGTRTDRAITQLTSSGATLARVTGTVLENIRIARLQRAQESAPNEMTPFSTIFLSVLPALAENKVLAGKGLAVATSPVGKWAIKMLALKAIEEQELSAQEKEILKATIPVALEILDILDLTGPKAQEEVQKITKILDLITRAINSEEEPDSAAFAKEFMAELSELKTDAVVSAHIIVNAIKSINTLPG